MLDANFLATLNKEGVAPIVTWNGGEPHLAATWNSYIHKTDDDRLLIPVMGMQTTQTNLAGNNRVKMIIGSKEVMGKYGPGAGFLLEGTAKILHEGDELSMMKKKIQLGQLPHGDHCRQSDTNGLTTSYWLSSSYMILDAVCRDISSCIVFIEIGTDEFFA